MKVSQLLISTAAVASVVGAFGLTYAQSNRSNINVQGPTNLTQTQSDAALPCQPSPFNPHLPQGTKDKNGNIVNRTSTDCATPVTTSVQVKAEPQVVITQTQSPAPAYTAPVQQVAAAPEPQYVPRNEVRTDMSAEPMARADRN
ncbi:MAG: hypothetical protein LH481_09680 [Burkholderiales bacterium]|nr:hypothetical protein [Burkholderiales bacterium]